MRKNITESSQLEDLLEAYRQGDWQAFDKFFHLTKDPLYSFVKKKIQNSELAADIVQDVYLRIHRHILHFDRTEGAALSWIFSIAHNCVRDAYKQCSVERKRHLAVMNGPNKSFQDAEDRIFFRELIFKLKHNISEEELRILMQRVLGDSSFKEIGETERIQPENARQKFSRLLKKLKPYLQD